MNRQVQIGEMEVDNPRYAAEHDGAPGNPRRSFAAVNLRESPIVTLYQRKSLTPHQFKAGVRFHGLWATYNGLRGGSFAEHVDGYRQSYISDSVIDAGRELERCRKAVHLPLTYLLLCEVVGQGRPIIQTTYVRATSNVDMGRRMATQYMVHGLDDMATMWGLMHNRLTT